jgi:hypothetical protein
VESTNLHVYTCHMSHIEQMSRSLKQRYHDHIRYIKHNEPQLAYALHILNNKHEYGPINATLTLLKYIDKTRLLLPYEQLYIHSYHHKQLIAEQHIGKHNSIYQLIYNLHNMSCPTILTDQYSCINTNKNQFHPTRASSQPTLRYVQQFYYNVRIYCIFWNTVLFIIQNLLT